MRYSAGLKSEGGEAQAVALSPCVGGRWYAASQIVLEIGSVSNCIGLYASPCVAQNIRRPPKRP